MSFFFHINTIFPKNLVLESSGFLENVSTHKISDGKEFKIFTIKGHFRYNVGIYGVSECSGYRETKNDELLFLKVICDNTTQHGDKFTTLGERKSEFNKAGVGQSKYLDGTGVFKKLIGTNCVYAVNKVLSSDFVVGKCNISEKLYLELKKYGEK